MESIAFERAGLSEAPLSGYKGWFGHTLGAAGLLETAIALKALQDGVVIRTEGLHETGVPGRVNVLREDARARGPVLLKTSSGFGGSNAAVIIEAARASWAPLPTAMERSASVIRASMRPPVMRMDGSPLPGPHSHRTTRASRADRLSRLVLLSAATFFDPSGGPLREVDPEHVGMLLLSCTGSMESDARYCKLLRDEGVASPKYNEIADMFDLPLGTVKSRIFFARKALKDMIKKSYGDYYLVRSMIAY